MLNRAERDQMILNNRGLAITVARKYSRNPDEYEDILQCAFEGLIKAVDRYDPERPTKFSTMAYPWIVKHTLKFCAERGIVHVPHMRRYQDAKVQKISNRVYARTGVRLANPTPFSDTYGEVNENSSVTYKTQYDDMEYKEDCAMLEEAKYELSEREKTVIKLRLEGVGPKDTGDKFGCSKQRANQLFNKALKKLQNYMVD